MTPLPGIAEEIAFIKKNLGAEALTLDESKASVDEVAAYLPTVISKKDGHRHRNVFKWYVDILMYSKNRKLFNIHMTAFLVL